MLEAHMIELYLGVNSLRLGGFKILTFEKFFLSLLLTWSISNDTLEKSYVIWIWYFYEWSFIIDWLTSYLLIDTCFLYPFYLFFIKLYRNHILIMNTNKTSFIFIECHFSQFIYNLCFFIIDYWSELWYHIMYFFNRSLKYFICINKHILLYKVFNWKQSRRIDIIRYHIQNHFV